MKIRYLLVLFFTCNAGFTLPLFSQVSDTTISILIDEEIAAPEEDYYDDDEIYDSIENASDELEIPEPPYFSKDSLGTIKMTKPYVYMSNLDSLLKDYKLKNKPEPPLDDKMFDIGWFKFLLWGIAIFGLLYVLYQLLGGQGQLFSRSKKLAGNTIVPSEINLAVPSSIMMAQDAAAKGDFTTAVGYLHKFLIQGLDKKQFIVMEPQKTNHQYLKELRSRPFYNEFATLTLQYEYVWFGDFQINQQQYQDIEKGFRKFIETWL